MSTRRLQSRILPCFENDRNYWSRWSRKRLIQLKWKNGAILALTAGSPIGHSGRATMKLHIILFMKRRSRWIPNVLFLDCHSQVVDRDMLISNFLPRFEESLTP